MAVSFCFSLNLLAFAFNLSCDSKVLHIYNFMLVKNRLFAVCAPVCVCMSVCVCVGNYAKWSLQLRTAGYQ